MVEALSKPIMRNVLAMVAVTLQKATLPSRSVKCVGSAIVQIGFFTIMRINVQVSNFRLGICMDS